MSLIPWHPFPEAEHMRQEMRKFLENPFFPYQAPAPGDVAPAWGPRIDLRETDRELILSAELPGIKPEDLDIRVDEDRITIKGETRRSHETETGGYRLTERRYGSFHRSLALPVKIKPGEAQADYRDGILEISMPKAEEHSNRSVRLRLNPKKYDH